jgi:hypothetical protein
LASARKITRDTQKLFEEKLEFRNACAHPNAILGFDLKVVSFAEDLVNNVILRLHL